MRNIATIIAYLMCFLMLSTFEGCNCLIAGPGGYLKHVPPTSIVAGERTKLVYEFEGKGRVTKLACHYRGSGTDAFVTIPMTQVRHVGQTTIYECTLPPFGADVTFVEYYFDLKCDGVYNRHYDTTIPVVPPPASQPTSATQRSS